MEKLFDFDMDYVSSSVLPNTCTYNSAFEEYPHLNQMLCSVWEHGWVASRGFLSGMSAVLATLITTLSFDACLLSEVIFLTEIADERAKIDPSFIITRTKNPLTV